MSVPLPPPPRLTARLRAELPALLAAAARLADPGEPVSLRDVARLAGRPEPRVNDVVNQARFYGVWPHPPMPKGPGCARTRALRSRQADRALAGVPPASEASLPTPPPSSIRVLAVVARARAARRRLLARHRHQEPAPR